MQLSRASPVNWTQFRSVARNVARVCAFAPVGFVAEDDVLICVESLAEELVAPLEYVPVAGAEVLDDVELFDRSMARVGSVADEEALQCVESLDLPDASFEVVFALLASLGYALVPGGDPVGLVADEDVLCCVESDGLDPDELIYALDGEVDVVLPSVLDVEDVPVFADVLLPSADVPPVVVDDEVELPELPYVVDGEDDELLDVDDGEDEESDVVVDGEDEELDVVDGEDEELDVVVDGEDDELPYVEDGDDVLAPTDVLLFIDVFGVLAPAEAFASAPVAEDAPGCCCRQSLSALP